MSPRNRIISAVPGTYSIATHRNRTCDFDHNVRAHFGLAAKTAGGAVLLYDGEVYERPIWTITRHEISFRIGNCAVNLYDANDGERTSDVLKDLKARIRVLIDA